MKLMLTCFFSTLTLLAFGQEALKTKFEKERYYWSTSLMKVLKEGNIERHSALVLGHRWTKDGITSDEQVYIKSNRVATKDKPHEVYRYDISFDQKTLRLTTNGEVVKGTGIISCNSNGRCDYTFTADDESMILSGRYNFSPIEGLAFSERLKSNYKDEGKDVSEEYDGLYSEITEEVYHHLYKQLVVTGQ